MGPTTSFRPVFTFPLLLYDEFGSSAVTQILSLDPKRRGSLILVAEQIEQFASKSKVRVTVGRRFEFVFTTQHYLIKFHTEIAAFIRQIFSSFLIPFPPLPLSSQISLSPLSISIFLFIHPPEKTIKYLSHLLHTSPFITCSLLSLLHAYSGDRGARLSHAGGLRCARRRCFHRSPPLPRSDYLSPFHLQSPLQSAP